MLNIKRILHPTDFSPGAQAALRQAVDQARRFGARLDVLHVGPTFGENPLRGGYEVAVDEKAFYTKKLRQADVQMRAMLETCDVRGLALRRTYTRAVSPAPAIVAYAASEATDLIVMGTHGRRGLRRLLMGSVARAVIREATCPVLVVRTPAAPEAEAVSDSAAPAAATLPGPIVVPIDFSEAARRALVMGRHLAATTGARLVLLHIVSPLQYPDFYETSLLKTGEVERRLADKAAMQMDALYAETAAPTVTYERLSVTGHTPRAILDVAETRRAACVVMATRNRSGMDTVLAEQVTNAVVAAAPCPVLVIKVDTLLPLEEKANPLKQAELR